MSNGVKLKLSKEIFVDKFYPEFLDYSKRHNIYYGGASSGKSVFVPQKIIFKYLNDPGRRCLVIRKVGKDIRESIFEQFIEILKAWEIYDFCKIRTSYLEIELPNKSKFIFKGFEDEERIKSITRISDIIVEEATEISANDYSQLALRLRGTKANKQMYVMFNPIGKWNWVYKKWFSGNWYNEKVTKIIHSTYKDNKFLPQEDIDEIESWKISDPHRYRIYGLGEFGSIDKLVYDNSNIIIDDFNYNELIKENKDITALFGLDFGFTADPTAFIALLHDKVNKNIYIYEEFYERGMLNDNIYNEIVKRGYKKEIILADSASPKDIADLKRLGIDRIKAAKKGPGSILNGIQYIQQHNIIIHSSCINTIEEINNYTWVKGKDGEYINEATDKDNHLMDALRYAVSETNTIGKVTFFKRSQLF